MSYIATGFEAEIESHPAAFHAAERNRSFVFVKTTRAISSIPLVFREWPLLSVALIARVVGWDKRWRVYSHSQLAR